MGSIMIELKGKLIYKSNILFTMFAALASILVQIALWQYLYRDDAAMMGNMMGYVIYANVKFSVQGVQTRLKRNDRFEISDRVAN